MICFPYLKSSQQLGRQGNKTEPDLNGRIINKMTARSERGYKDFFKRNTGRKNNLFSFKL